ncbi:MAG: hypothetical protein EP329_08705, partial [Deltaproteobacteria bacterium]
MRATVALTLTLFACGDGTTDAGPDIDRDASLFDTLAQDSATATGEDALAVDSAAPEDAAVDDAASNDASDDTAAPPDTVAADTAEADTVVPDPAPPVLWFVHISDTHVGSSSRASATLAYVFETVVPTVDPVATIHTGDLVDDGGEADQWAAYAELVKAAPAWPRYVELIGNHDKKNDGTPSWMASSVSGPAGAGLYGQLFWDTPAGRVRLIRADTSDSSINATNVAGYFGGDQRDDLLALPAGDPPPVLTLVAGHHPINGLTALTLLGSGDRMDALLGITSAAAYLCGHVHEVDIAPHDDTLAVQAPSLGKPGGLSGITGFTLVAWDGGAVSAQVVLLEGDTPTVDWPVLMVTHPTHGGKATLGEGVEVRALAFAPAGVDTVEARLAGGTWAPLSAADNGVWRGPLTQA